MSSYRVVPPVDLWVIEHARTKEWLGTRDRHSWGGLEFGGRMPLFYGSLKTAREAWLRAAVELDYLKRGVTLARGKPRYHPGPEFDMMPSIRYRQMALVEKAVAIDTPADLEYAVEQPLRRD